MASGISRLAIIYKNSKQETGKAQGHIEFPLYEANYISAVRNIFHSALNQKIWVEENKKKIFKNEAKNIIAFIGDRGSGKTTAMDEFCRILRHMHQEDKLQWWLLQALGQEGQMGLSGKRFKFYITAPIDASLLGEKDDLFELILVNMYQAFQEDLETDITNHGLGMTAANEVIELFQELLKSYHISKENKIEKVYSAFSLMNYMAGSYEIQKNVAILIDKLLALKKIRHDFEYIVVAIDDLDLNLCYGYQMLEMLQKYFAYHKIIILAAIDYKQMSLVCEGHFVNETAQTAQTAQNDYEVSRNEHNRMLANDYMTKTFLFSQRMYMPDMKKIARNICILESNSGKEEEIPVKKYIMAKIARKMRIFYDGCGLKWHFCELGTVRELASYNDFLELLIPVEFEELVFAEPMAEGQKAKNLRILRSYDRNHEQFNRDIVMRLSQNMLTPHQRDIFLELDKRDLERRANYFVSLTIEKEDRAHLYVGTILEYKYTYGDLLQKIYQWGRCYFEIKPLISCMIASFTAEMVREYLNYRYNPIPDSKESSRRRLVGFLGDSFCNAWSGKAFPKIRIKVNDNLQEVRYGYEKEVSQSLISIDINLKGLRELDFSDWEEVKEDLRDWIIQEKIVETLEYIDLFFIRKEENGYKGLSYFGKFVNKETQSRYVPYDSHETNNSNPSDGEKMPDKMPYLNITGNGEPVTLDIMAFVLKSLDYIGHKNELQENIADILNGMLAAYLPLELRMEDIREFVQSVITERSLYSKYVGNDFNYETAFPFYDFDMSYNVIKRLRKKFRITVVDEVHLPGAIRKFLGYIGDCLHQEQKFYEIGGQSICQYEENFMGCPYVKALLSQELEGTVAIRLSKVLRSVKSNLEMPDDVDAWEGWD